MAFSTRRFQDGSQSVHNASQSLQGHSKSARKPRANVTGRGFRYLRRNLGHRNFAKLLGTTRSKRNGYLLLAAVRSEATAGRLWARKPRKTEGFLRFLGGRVRRRGWAGVSQRGALWKRICSSGLSSSSSSGFLVVQTRHAHLGYPRGRRIVRRLRRVTAATPIWSLSICACSAASEG